MQKKVSKLRRKSYLTKRCLNLPKLGNFFDEGLFEIYRSKFEQILTTLYYTRFSLKIGSINNFETYKKYFRQKSVIIFSRHFLEEILILLKKLSKISLTHFYRIPKFFEVWANWINFLLNKIFVPILTLFLHQFLLIIFLLCQFSVFDGWWS